MNEDDIGGMAAELTGTTGLDNHPDDDTPIPHAIADEVEAFQNNAADKAQRIADAEDGTDQDGRDPTADQDKRGDSRKVPLGALQQERIRRQELQAQLAAQQLQYQQMQQQLAQYQQMQQLAAAGPALVQPGAVEETAIPEFNEDPEGHVKALTERFQRELQNVQGQAQAQQEATQRQQVAQLVNQVNQAEQEFMAQPDIGVEQYQQAHEIVHQNVMASLQQRFPQATAEQLQAAQQGAAFHFIQWCTANQKNPAAEIWSQAQQLGYTPGARVPASQQSEHRTPGYAIPTGPRQVTANTSLGALAGSHSPEDTGKLTAEKVGNMSDAEFDKLCKEMKSANNRGVFGG